MLKLKEKNAKLKVLLSIGGWTEASRSVENVVSNPLKMQEFAKNAVNFLRKHKFDGLSVDWELPTSFKKELTKLLEVNISVILLCFFSLLFIKQINEL